MYDDYIYISEHIGFFFNSKDNHMIDDEESNKSDLNDLNMDCNDKYVSYSISVYASEQNVSRYLRIMYRLLIN